MVGLKGAGKTTILHRLIGEIVQGYRNRYNPINCGHKNVLVHPTAGQIHERFSESFRCAEIINLCLFYKVTIIKIISVSLALKLSQQLLQLASMLKLSKLKISPSLHGMLEELKKMGYFGVTTFTNMSER